MSSSIHPSSVNTQISAYSSPAICIISSTVGHLGAFPFPPFPLPFPLPLPLPFPLLLALASALAEQTSIAALAFSPRAEPAWQIIIMFSFDRQRPAGSALAGFPPFPSLAFLNLAWTEATVKDTTRIRIRLLMLDLV